MAKPKDNPPIRRMLVIMPRLLDESVMATAALHALRQAHPEAHITALVRRRFRAVVHGLDSVDRVLSVRTPGGLGNTMRNAKKRPSLIRLGRRLSGVGFDAAVILPNTFRAAALAAVAGIPRRVGYEREGRSVLLTDRLITRRTRGERIGVSPLDSYLGIARYLGADNPSPQLRQAVHPEADAKVRRALTEQGIDPASDKLLLVSTGRAEAAQDQSLDLMARVCAGLVSHAGLTPILINSTADPEDAARLRGRTDLPIIELAGGALELHTLKALIARGRMMVTHDTAARHFAAAFGVPLLTLSSDSSTADRQHTYEAERHLRIGAADHAEAEQATQLAVSHYDMAAPQPAGAGA